MRLGLNASAFASKIREAVHVMLARDWQIPATIASSNHPKTGAAAFRVDGYGLGIVGLVQPTLLVRLAAAATLVGALAVAAVAIWVVVVVEAAANSQIVLARWVADVAVAGQERWRTPMGQTRRLDCP